MLRCIVIDDDMIALRGMRQMLDARDDVEVSAMFDDPCEAMAWLKENDADLLFLDIRMPGMSGLDIASMDNGRGLVIFTTAYDNHAVEAFAAGAVDYLVKPIDEARFRMAVDRAVARHEMMNAAHAPDYITVRSERRFMRVAINEIQYIEGLRDYVIIKLPAKRILTKTTLANILHTLPARQFMRVSKSFIVNLSKVEAYSAGLLVADSREIHIGSAFRHDVMAALSAREGRRQV